MKYFIVFTQLVLVSGIAMGQGALPSDINPVSGEIFLKYTPKFESRCTIKTSGDAQGMGGFPPSAVTQITEVFDDPMGTKFATIPSMEQSTTRLVFALNDDGSFSDASEPAVQMDQKQSESDRKAMADGKKASLIVMKKLYQIGVLGKPLHQGTAISFDLCELLGGDSRNKSGHFAVVGTSLIKGRVSLIYSGESASDCALGGGQQMYIKSSGWHAYDSQSGLPSGGSMKTSFGQNGKAVVSGVETRDCAITGELTKVQNISSSSPTQSQAAEQRLLQLKGLLDKKLITPEQFEKKQAEILNSI